MNHVALAYKQVAEASAPYESRWTLRALLTHDKELYLKFREQQNLWCESLVTGSEADIKDQTAAMCRGWAAIAQRMDEAEVDDDAYLIGSDDGSGVLVAISDQKASRARVEELYGERVIFVAPCEVAAMLGRSEVIRAMKGEFPGAELVS